MRQRATSPAGSDATVSRVEAAAYVVPTDAPESDGTFEWDSTTIVVAEVEAGGVRGTGYSYTDAAAVRLIADLLAPAVQGCDAMNVAGAWTAMQAAVRNVGRQGLAATAISAVDSALWDLKGRLLGLPLAALLGAVRERVPVYGSGGFTSYTVARLQTQFADWVEAGIGRVKMKVGRDAAADPARVLAARDAIGESAELFVDANGAWNAATAIAMAERFRPARVSWFEEPVTSDALHDLRRVRDRMPSGTEVAAGEYGYDLQYFRRMLEAGAVDVLQADATRCAGITGFLQVGALCDAFMTPLSAHTAPSLHAAPCCALPRVRHVEYFHDHSRIEQLFFDGAPRPADGEIPATTGGPGLGLDFKRADASQYRVS